MFSAGVDSAKTENPLIGHYSTVAENEVYLENNPVVSWLSSQTRVRNALSFCSCLTNHQHVYHRR